MACREVDIQKLIAEIYSKGMTQAGIAEFAEFKSPSTVNEIISGKNEKGLLAAPRRPDAFAYISSGRAVNKKGSYIKPSSEVH